MSYSAPARVLLAYALALTMAPLMGQDLTVSPIHWDETETALSWLDPDDPPDTLPSLKNSLDPRAYPGIRETSRLEYLTEQLIVDERGNVAKELLQTTVALDRQSASSKSNQPPARPRLTFLPATRGDRPVISVVRFAVISNPKSADEGQADATPRLIDAAPIVDPKRAGGILHPPRPPEVVWEEVSVDVHGTPKLIEPADDVAALINEGIKTFRFVPARIRGVAVPQNIRVPFVIVPPESIWSAHAEFPHILTQQEPEYPDSLAKSGMRGEVDVEFVVDREGKVLRPAVVRSNNPAFNEPALAAVRQWTFKPAHLDERLLYAKMGVPIVFILDNFVGGGTNGVSVLEEANKSKLPKELRYDVAPVLQDLVIPVYPYALLFQGVKGTAEVGLVVDAHGMVAASKVISASQPEFGLALQAAVERFRYDPARKHGNPCEAVLRFEHHFDPDEKRFITESDNAALVFEKEHPEKIVGARNLDGPIHPMVAHSPVFLARSLAECPRAMQWSSCWSIETAIRAFRESFLQAIHCLGFQLPRLSRCGTLRRR